jgi:hypothetical protein
MWIIKTEHGYMLEDDDGNLVEWFDMAANCKAYCMEKGIEPIYIAKNRGRLVDVQAYKAATGKDLWFDLEYLQ